LGLREQVVIRLKVYRPEKFTYREIAKIVGFSPSTVRVKYDEYWNRINNYVEQGMSENA
jgi:DNA-directed RNA polymerase specialized sigma24 family protein